MNALWRYFVLGILMVIPYFKGAFNFYFQLIFLIVCLAGLAVHLVMRPGNIKERFNALDGVALALAVVYFAAITWGVNPRAALQEGLKQLTYLSIYWLTSRSISGGTNAQSMLKALAVTFMLVTSAAIVTVSGWIPYQDAIYSNRVGGPFQYPNTTAAYLLAGMALALSLRVSASDLRGKLTWAAMLSAEVVVFAATYSRLGWAVGLAMFVGAILLAPKEKRSETVRALAAAAVGAAAVLLPIDTLLKSGKPALFAVWVLVGVLITVALDLGFHWMQQWAQKYKWINRTMAGLSVLLLLAAAYVVETKAANLLARLQNLSSQDSSWLQRVWMIRDALRAWSDAPFFGLGGAGWRSVFTGYRTFTFVSRVIHSSVVETLVEVGLVGCGLMLAFWWLGLWQGWRIRQRQSNATAQMLWSGALLGLLAMLLHSLVDFDYWYPAFTVMIYALIGVVRAESPTTAPLDRKDTTWRSGRIVVAVGLVMLAIFGGRLAAGMQISSDAFTELGNKNYTAARQKFELSLKYDPWYAPDQAQYGSMLLDMGTQLKRREDVQLAGVYLKQATESDSHNPTYWQLLSDYYMNVGNLDKSMELALKAVDLDTVTVETYSWAMERGLTLFSTSLNQQQFANAKRYLQQMGTILDRFQTMQQRQPKGALDQFLLEPNFNMDFDVARYDILVGKYEEAKTILGKPDLAKGQNQVEAMIWAAAAENKLGHVAEADAILAALRKLNPDGPNTYVKLMNTLEAIR